MFWLNFLPSVDGNETCDIECWGLRQPLSEYSFFLTISEPRNCFVKKDSFSFTPTNSLSGLWLTLSHVQLTAPDRTCCKVNAILCLNCYFETCLTFLENPLKWLAEEMIQFLKAPNYIRHVLLEHSTICRWKETCDIECWGLTQPLSEYSFFLTISGLENAWWKTDIFSFTRTSSLSGLWFTLYHVQLTAQTWQVANLLHICAWIVTLPTCLTLLKNPLKWLAEEMIQLMKAPNLIRHVLLERVYHLAMERDLWHWMLRPQTTT